MHDDQIETTTDLMRSLLAAQFPQWSDLPIQPVQESGTDHALYRIGDALVARLAIIEWAVDQAESDQRWLPLLAPSLTLPIPVPVAVGQPGEGYPWPWLVVPWILGETPNGDNLDLASAAVALAQFVMALHGIQPCDGPVKSGTTRGVPLANLDEGIHLLIQELGDNIDTAAVTRVWDEAVAGPCWDGPLVWIHGDITPGNLIVRGRRPSSTSAAWAWVTRHQTWRRPGTSSTTDLAGAVGALLMRHLRESPSTAPDGPHARVSFTSGLRPNSSRTWRSEERRA